MSKAFTKEDEGGADQQVVPRRVPLPNGTPNYVTPRGLAALRAELAAVADTAATSSGAEPAASNDERRALERREVWRRDLESRVASAIVIDYSPAPPEQVRFGARVRLRFANGNERTVVIVGVDEADATAGLVAFVSPLARAVLGRQAGDTVTLRTPAGEEELQLLAVAYDDDDSDSDSDSDSDDRRS